MNRKKKIFIVVLVMLVISLLLDFCNAKYNNTRPIFSIKFEDKEKQMIFYNAIFYRTIQCTAEEDHYTTKSYFDKIGNNFCPKSTSYGLQFQDGYFINKHNVKITKEFYEELLTFYSTEEIYNMTEEQINEAFTNNTHKPITNP